MCIYIHIIVYIYITSDYSHHHPPQADTVRAVRGAMATAAMARDPNVEAADFRGKKTWVQHETLVSSHGTSTDSSLLVYFCSEWGSYRC